MEIFLITERSIVLNLKTQIFDKLQLKQLSSMFLQVNSTVLVVFLTIPTVFKIFKIQEKSMYQSFFIFQNISKTRYVFKNCGHSLSLPITSDIQKSRNINYVYLS